MTRKAFLKFVVGVTIYYLALIVVAWHGYSPDPDDWSALTRFIKEFVALLTALPAAVLAFAVQQRLVFVKEVRDIYKECVMAVQDAITFCKIATLDDVEKLRVLKGLSVVMDRVRAVYSDEKSTKYPVDGLKRIFLIVEGIKAEDQFVHSLKGIVDTWKTARQVFLTEIDLGVR